MLRQGDFTLIFYWTTNAWVDILFKHRSHYYHFDRHYFGKQNSQDLIFGSFFTKITKNTNQNWPKIPKKNRFCSIRDFGILQISGFLIFGFHKVFWFKKWNVTSLIFGIFFNKNHLCLQRMMCADSKQLKD